ncbi:ABC transporter substrate-binding protein [Rufibacter sp. XAAS-G3-1]|uniref:ABC transporter substrate-binding protein n=1 Tax=Rufibacter sp. XAAS-G3-1 TaxID=2729134 RepID=UPI0015E6C899|nr:ABC transporter substrate-binding protein [Rufibacter sp. XAAS-G3-1]
MKNYCAKCLSFIFICILSCTSKPEETGIRIRFDQDPESLHPLSYGNAPALQILNHVYQSLLTVDLADKSIRPLLAAELPSVRKTDSTSLFTFSIRPEAQWDNGSPITAQDVAFSLKLLHSPLIDNERWRAQYEFIKDIQLSQRDPRSFTLVCSGYTPEMRLMAGDFFVLPSYQFDPKGTLASVSYQLIRQKFDSLALTPTFKAFATIINNVAMARDTSLIKGSGPYRLRKWNAGQSITLEKKKPWWGDGVNPHVPALQARPSHIVFQIIPDNASAILALKASQLELMDNIPLIPFLEMQRERKYQQLFNFHTPTSYELIFMGVNGQNPILQDRSTRQALAHLLDIPQIINSLQGGLATPTVGFVHPQEKEFYNSDLPILKFDKPKARNLLLAAGWRQTSTGWEKKINGKIHQLKLDLLHKVGNSDFENMSLLFQQNAKSLGIPVTLQALESSQISERLQTRKFDLYFRTLIGNPFSYNLIPLLHTSNAKNGGGNVTSFGTAETDLLLEKIANEELPEEKALLLKSLQQKMQEESNMIFLYFSKNRIAVSKQMDSVIISGLKPGYDVTRAFLKK